MPLLLPFCRSVTAERGKRKKMVLSDSSDEEEQPKKTTKSAPAHTLSDDEDFTTQVNQREMGG